MELINQWSIKPLSLPRAGEYLEDLSDLRFADSGILTEVNPFFFVNEACQLLANSVRLFELGYFDCAFYSIRQAIELSLSGLYLFSNPDKIKGWKNLEKGFELRTIVPELKVGKEEFAEIKELFSDFFERIEKEKKSPGNAEGRPRDFLQRIAHSLVRSGGSSQRCSPRATMPA